MKAVLLTLILLSQLYSDQNTSAALGAQKDFQTPTKVYKQKDGSSFIGISRGEEYFNYIQLQNGYSVLYNCDSEQYEYAHVKDGTLRPSGIPVQSGTKPKNLPKIPQQTLKQLQEDAYKKHF